MTSYIKKGLAKAQDAVTRTAFGKAPPTTIQAFFDIVDKNMKGEEVPMSNYKGSVLAVVNVASKWGLTKANYTQLTKLVDEYGDKGFKVLAFPCNQFGAQEPGTAEEILTFAHQFDSADTKFDFFEKGDVNGANTRDVFSFLKQKLPNDDGTTDIRWNFNIFVVDKEGNPSQRYQPGKNPYEELKPKIEELLAK